MERCSVIIPTYERPKNLRKAIESVVNQDYEGIIEIIVVDDSDVPELKGLDLENPKRFIKYYRGENKGAPSARNYGYCRNSHEFVTFLDDDDTWEPEKIRLQIEELKKHPDVGLCICYSKDKRFGIERINKPPDRVTHRDVIKSFNLSSTSSYMLRRSFCERIENDGSLFDKDLVSAQEYDLAIRMSRISDIICIPKVLMTQNSTKGQISTNPRRKIMGIFQLFRKHRHDYHAIDYIKTFGVMFMFFLYYFARDAIYKIIIPIKEIYEQ